MANEKETATTAQKPMDVIIIGGSCAGLMSGILLKRKGHNVRILEVAVSSEREALAAGIGLQRDVKSFFEVEDVLRPKPLGVVNPGFRVLDEKMDVKYQLPVSLNLTSWDAVYYRLRANFDGYSNLYNPELPPHARDAKEGSVEFITGKKALKVEDVKGRMTVFAEDVRTKDKTEYTGDLVIAADGTNSTIRRQLMPRLQREEPGYVIWRGTIPTKNLSQDILDKIENKPLVCPYKHNYLVIYTIPGEKGSLEPGQREINFAWYFWPKDLSLKDIMTDVDGHHHRTTIPKGKMRPSIWQYQIAQARRTLNPTIATLVESTPAPFVSVVSSIAAPKAAFFNNRLFLVGDALCQPQPNIGMGTTLGAYTLTLLVNQVICPSDGKPPLDPDNVAEWETKVLQECDVTRCRSVAFASWYLNTWPKIAVYYLRYYFKLYWQYWFGRRTRVFTSIGSSR
ncbi:hypothetical protein M409DRAFT_21629 [Zasmidium cellare ATCC 36951]|uniref:Uncharacterized protein n=1 Tax=Zasmidium cellare ATCC 36951 TaxID=1080233 RepID=A0A6A6CM07_ZASCE|nr:uncharacterized protein M409DRAFT_21629 [Zasmidium cellare ATCC 36951]KAF2168185.1 hypothetical protein M409DRAFT_21629 [Zasmidium cellare ATCC 36951]